MAEKQKEEETTKPAGLGIMGLVKAVAFVAVLVIVQLVAASMLLPSAQETETLARDLARAAEGVEFEDDISKDTVVVDEGEETSEVELGPFNITRFDPDSDKTLNIDFMLFGVVLLDEEADFMALFEKNRSRIGEQIVMTMHGAKISDLSSAGLGLIKRQILEKTNRTLGKPLLREVVFTKINFVER